MKHTVFKSSFYSFILSVLFFCASSNAHGQDIPNNMIAENPVEIRIDPRSAVASELPAKEIFSGIEFIPLERSKKSSFTTIDQLEFAGDYMFLFEKNNSIINGAKNSAIFIFNKNGKFQVKISNFRSSYFAVNYQAEEIVFRDFNSKGNWLFYNFKGNLLRTEPVPFGFTTFSFLGKNLVSHYQNYFFNASSGDILILKPEIRDYNLIVTKDFKEVDSFYLKFNKAVLGDSPELYAVGKNFYNSQKRYFIPEYEYKVYSLSSEGISSEFNFVFPALNSIPTNFLSLDKVLRANYTKNKYAIYAISDFYKVGEILTFRLNYNNSLPQTFFYDINTAIATAYSAIKPDVSSSSLPLGKTIVGADQNYFYSFLSAKELAKYKKNNVTKTSIKTLPSALRAYFTSENENPIMLRFKM